MSNEQHGLTSAQAVLENIRDLLKALETAEAAEDDEAVEQAQTAIAEDALEVTVRGGWHPVGGSSDPQEYNILITTGGPAVRLIGKLSNGDPETAELQHQDWFTPWVRLPVSEADEKALLAYAQNFYFGE